jgi:hypothetical protein
MLSTVEAFKGLSNRVSSFNGSRLDHNEKDHRQKTNLGDGLAFAEQPGTGPY